MPSDLQITNIKDQANANSAITIASDGQITVNQNNPTLTLGTNTTFSDGLIENQTIIKYAFSSNGSHSNTGTTEVITTRTSALDATVESVSVIGGYTYLYNFNIMMGCFRNSGGATSDRRFRVRLVDDSTDRTQGDTSISGTLAFSWEGRSGTASAEAGADSWVWLSMQGASYYSSNDTRYIFLTTTPPASNHKVSSYQSDTYPAYLTITKIKGNILTSRS